MKFIDSIRNFIKVPDYDDFDDEFDEEYDDIEDDYLVRKRKNKSTSRNKGYEEEIDEEPIARSTRPTRMTPPNSNKVTPMRQPNTRQTTSSMGVCVIRPTAYEDSREISDMLLENKTIILNLENVEFDIAQRLVDFTTGSAYSLHGNLQKISNSIFLITPDNVDISGDLQNILGSTFDLSSVRSRY